MTRNTKSYPLDTNELNFARQVARKNAVTANLTKNSHFPKFLEYPFWTNVFIKNMNSPIMAGGIIIPGRMCKDITVQGIYRKVYVTEVYGKWHCHP